MWSCFWQSLRIRGAKTVIITKVKGHATQVRVDECKVQEEDKAGNDAADRAAEWGVNSIHEGANEFAKWVQRRMRAYTQLMEDINRVMVAVLAEETKVRK